eukprot:CAMPEP_0172575574 /NCGR_PEP_ID=MMETSP1067-20121228/137282_1 /TAXON_ID=265564 ORGANISM="Thalassiosira punctigera, Strain Tpunct2005C2" /NCGR_SAMPLE_ID=MMETSP1067 /ASSEMBLY_ACC=CAM_ASM_000444 /LENGTH=440 /DNA_ID=CAMNT_0013368225 /DNA_START=25 /DNA_END=1347 /DNA_ORIENTATION=-
MRSTSLLAVLAGTSDAFSSVRRLPLQPVPTIIQHHTPANVARSSGTALHAKRRGKLANNVSMDEDGNVRLISNKQKQKLGSSKGRRGKKQAGGGDAAAISPLLNNVSMDEDGNVRLISNKQKQKLGSSKGRRGGKQGGGGSDAAAISPLLAEWAKEDDDEGASSPAKTTVKTAPSATAAANVFVPFDDDDDEGGFGGKKSKRNKKSRNKESSPRAVLSAAQIAQTEELLGKISETLETNGFDVPTLVSDIKALADLNSLTNDRTLLPSLKSILSARPKEDSERPAYRLAWAGSDEGICHIGTSLHKVPLARLQEMYLLLGFGKWELLEVIRILGPFPNVRNTLKGELKVNKMQGVEREGARLEVKYQSMIDGTGKEILAGGDVKVVGLDVWFANEKAMVCTIPGDDEEGGDDPMSGDGSNMLLFVAEEDVDGQLEKLRAA